MLQRYLVGMGALALVNVSISTAQAKNSISVPQEYSTISQAVNAAANGDNIIVAPGFYDETVTITNKSVLITSANVSDRASLFQLRVFGLATVIIDNMIVGGPEAPFPQDAIISIGASLTLRESEIRSRTFVRSGTYLVVDDCEIPGNLEVEGIDVSDTPMVIIRDTSIAGGRGFNGICSGTLLAQPQTGYAALSVFNCPSVVVIDCFLKGGDGGFLNEGECSFELPITVQGGPALRARRNSTLTIQNSPMLGGVGAPRGQGLDNDGTSIMKESVGHDFDVTAFPDGWEARQIIPKFITQLPNNTGGDPTLQYIHAADAGVQINTLGLNNFGLLQTSGTNRIIGYSKPGQVLIQKWTVSSNAENPNQTAKIRVRSNIDGFAEANIYQEAVSSTGNQGVSTPPAAANGATALTLLSYTPESAFNGDPRDGFSLAFDSETLGSPFLTIGNPGNSILIRSVEFDALNPEGLLNEAVVYEGDFRNHAEDNFGFTVSGNGQSAGIAGIPVNVNTDEGLGLFPGGPPSSAGLAFGFWSRPMSEWVVDATKLYRVDYTVASTATNTVATNVARLRIDVSETAGLPDFVKEAVIESGGTAADPEELPTRAGRTYTTFVNFPPVLNGLTVNVYFDAYQTLGSLPDGTPVDGGVILKDLTVRSYNRPSGI